MCVCVCVCVCVCEGEREEIVVTELLVSEGGGQFEQEDHSDRYLLGRGIHCGYQVTLYVAA